MRLHNQLLFLTTLVVAFISGWCGRHEPPKPANTVSALVNELKSTAPRRLQAGLGEEVTFFPTYGYREGDDWKINIRGWAHQNRSHLNKIVTKLMTAIATVKDKCDSAELANFQSRSNDFEDDDKSLEKVIIKFDSDPDAQLFEFNKRSDANGIVELDLTLTDERAKQLLASEKSTNGWLTFSAVSDGHTGRGRIRLIEPEGLSLISDIDDTIKESNVGNRRELLANTVLREFRCIDGMAELYRAWAAKGAAFHYVSSSPWQLFDPIHQWTSSDGFPAGTLHLRTFRLRDQVIRRKANAKRRKRQAIATMLKVFPRRKFILIGDSGERDPEIYGKMCEKYGDRIAAVFIRDLENQRLGSQRFKKMKSLARPTARR